MPLLADLARSANTGCVISSFGKKCK
ncbi:Hypothetical protein SSCIU_01257 [Mammaliicoccus sciuri]|nr:Hypothetical protein SSCIU_01257 [Mammaliicoccus sciuri]